MNKKIVWGAIIVIIIVVGVVIARGGKQSIDSIRIAFIGPLSGDGVVWGEIEKNTIALAVDEINKNGGINGKKIEVKYEDGKCEGPVALSAAKKLVEVDKIKILLVSCSQEMLSIAPYANANKVIAFASYASASGITNAGPYIFRNSYTNGDMGRGMAEVAFGKGKKAAIISEQSAFASDLRDFFVDNYNKLGGEVVSSEGFGQGSRDFRTQILKVIGNRPDILVLNPNGPESGVALLKQLRQLGYKGPLVGNFFGGSSQVQKTSEAEGMIYVADPTFSESPLKQKVFVAYKQKYGVEPDLPWPVGARYDAVYILEQAITAVGDDPTALMNYLHNMPKDFTGIIGTYRFNKNNADISNVQPSIAVIKNGSSMSQ